MFGVEPQPARMAMEQWDDPLLHMYLGLHNPGSSRQVMNVLIRKLDALDGTTVDGYIFVALGAQPYNNEGMTKLYQFKEDK